MLMQRLDRRRADDERDLSSCGIECQQVQDRPALFFAADGDVLDHQVGLNTLDELVRAVPFLTDADLITLVGFKKLAHQLEKRSVVVDQRDMCPSHGSSVCDCAQPSAHAALGSLLEAGPDDDWLTAQVEERSTARFGSQHVPIADQRTAAIAKNV